MPSDFAGTWFRAHALEIVQSTPQTFGPPVKLSILVVSRATKKIEGVKDHHTLRLTDSRV
jgi:hypothetical protein